jgi:hypothetical protein
VHKKRFIWRPPPPQLHQKSRRKTGPKSLCSAFSQLPVRRIKYRTAGSLSPETPARAPTTERDNKEREKGESFSNVRDEKNNRRQLFEGGTQEALIWHVAPTQISHLSASRVRRQTIRGHQRCQLRLIRGCL